MSRNNKKALEGAQVRTPSPRTLLYRRLPVALTANFGPDVPYIIEAAISRPSSDRKRPSGHWPAGIKNMNERNDDLASKQNPSDEGLAIHRPLSTPLHSTPLEPNRT